MKSKVLKGSLVVVGALVLSSIGLFAADTLRGVDRSLVGLSGTSVGLCRPGMTIVKNGERSFCVDVYEAAASESCLHKDPGVLLESEENTSDRTCAIVSEKGKRPWRYISLTQAQQMCASVGKRLPTAEEWYAASLGTPPEACAINGNAGPVESGSAGGCVSSSGAQDMVGNVWEWVDETVTDGDYRDRALPRTGYVSSVDENGVAITTVETEQGLYGNDYFWSKEEGVYGMIRGGFYGGGADSGLYSINVSVQTSFTSPGVGFRCVEDVI